jgi:superfamily II DNA/RNA helicase
VLDQMPNVQQIDIHVELSPEQSEYHASYSKGVASIIRKRFLTAYDLQRLQLLLSSMRMVCDSTFLIDGETNVSPKLEELKHILFEQFDIKNSKRKIIIFSEWVKVHKLIGQMLRQNNIGFVELNGKVPVKLRGSLIKKFESNPECKIFLSTEAGGAGLNLQIANTLINFELPWNPAKKNQRIGRIDRLGQKSNNLTIYNFITRNSIEQQIAAGLLVKQSLFDSVLDGDSKTDCVDFSSKGRSQFIDQLEAFISKTESEIDADSIATESRKEVFEHEDELDEDIELTYSKEDDRKNPQTLGEEVPEKQETTLSDMSKSESKAAELEQVMTSGMQFLAGLFKMSTGKEMGMKNQQIAFNKETGEITMTFKLPS